MVESGETHPDLGPLQQPWPRELALWLSRKLLPEAEEVARKLLAELQPLLETACCSGQGEWEYLRICRASVLYLAHVLSARLHTPSSWECGNVPLTHILRATGADVIEFFREVPGILTKLETSLSEFLGPQESVDSVVGARLAECKTQLVLHVILARKFKAMYCEVFEVEQNQASATKSFRLGWMLMILTKGDLVPNSLLIGCFQLLVCFIHFLVMHSPKEMLRTKISKLFVDSPLSSLQHLSEMNKLEGVDNLQQVNELNQKMYTAVEDLLQPMIDCSKIEASQDAEQDSFRSFCDSLIAGERNTMDSCLKYLDCKYEELFIASRDIDERDFVADNFIPESLHATIPHPQTACTTSTLAGLSQGPGLMRHVTSSPQATPPRSMAACLQSPMPIHSVASNPTATPVSQSLSAMSWLREKTNQSLPEPSENLLNYFKSCSDLVGTGIQSKARQTANVVFPQLAAETTCRFGQKSSIRDEGIHGIILYYQVLESILDAEQERTGKSDFTSLLNSHTFHVALLTCSFEIIVKTHEIQTLEFPRLLYTLQLNGFDFSKVIEPFVKHVKDLPTSLKRHLFLIDEQIIESVAWHPGSSIYSLIAGACPPPLSKRATNGLSKESPTNSPPLPPPTFSQPKGPLTGLSPGPRSPKSAFKVFQSPSKKVRKMACSPGSKQISGFLPMRLSFREAQNGKKNPAKTVLDDFFRKVLKLTAFRLHDMKTFLMKGSLDPTKIVLQVYKVVQHALYEQTHLFYNRHLDQILLSALYGVCKANRLNFDFMDIIAQYQAQPRNRPEVYKVVILEQSYPELRPEKHGDIIEFYNKIFVPNMKTILLDSVHIEILSSPSNTIEDASRQRCASSKDVDHGQDSIRGARNRTMPIFEEDKAMKQFPNVHVSLANTKNTEGILPCSRRTMHAFMGKNKHPYQTPSQDLGMISARLHQLASSGLVNQNTQALGVVMSVECAPVSQPKCASPDLTATVKPELTGRDTQMDVPVSSPGKEAPICGGASETRPFAIPRVKVEPEGPNNARSPSVVSSTGSRSPVQASLQGLPSCTTDNPVFQNKAKRQKTDRCAPWDPLALRGVDTVDQDATQATK